jgi:pimeloyl-ACP methyl ester carboxylesterase
VPGLFKSPLLRFLTQLAMLTAGVLGIAAVGLERGWFELPMPVLVERYQLPGSRFVDVDGVRVHYVDEGSGDPVVLLHASYLSLHSWNALAAQLADRYRVIRLDLSGAGLTGSDPTGGYGIERNIELVRGVLASLGLERVALVGTSSGGVAAFRHAARFPEQVSRLVLINSAGMPRTAATNPLRARRATLTGWIEARLRSRRYWAKALEESFIPPHAPAPELVQMTYDMNRRAGGREITRLYIANFRTGDPQAELARVTAPTLILWGQENRTLMHLEAEVFAYWLAAAPRALKKYPGLGHYPYLEDPQTLAEDLDNFLAGRLDGSLKPPDTPRQETEEPAA